MRVMAIGMLREFWEKRPQAEMPLRSWYADACHADWRAPADIKATHRNASCAGSNRAVFHIKGKDYRLIVAVYYNRGMLYIRFVGNHAESKVFVAGHRTTR